jgi:hypothetical protein
MTDFVDCPVDLRYLADNQPSLCIPRVFTNIDEVFIRKTIENVGLGKVSRVDLLERRSPKGELYKRAFIHFEKWHWNPAAQEARKRLITGKDIKIVYNNPWFWKISANRWQADNRTTSIAPSLPPSIAPTLPVPAQLPMLSPPIPMRDERSNQSFQPNRSLRNQRKPRINIDSVPKPRFPKRDDYSMPKSGTDLKIDIPKSADLPAKTLTPHTPSTPPPIHRVKEVTPVDTLASEDQGLDIDYGNVPLPPPPQALLKLRRQQAKSRHNAP